MIMLFLSSIFLVFPVSVKENNAWWWQWEAKVFNWFNTFYVLKISPGRGVGGGGTPVNTVIGIFQSFQKLYVNLK